MATDTPADPPADPVAAVAVADLHLPERMGAWRWKSVPTAPGDALYQFAAAARLAAAHRVPLLAAGDLFDGPDPEPAALAAAYAALRPLAAAGQTFAYVLGNHDRGADWFAPFGPAAVNVNEVGGGLLDAERRPVWTSDGQSFWTLSGQSFRPHPLDAPGRPTDVGLYHQDFREFSRHGSDFSISHLPAHGLAVCGDTHAGRCLRLPRAPHGRGPALVLSPGPLAPQCVTEFGTPPGVWLCRRSAATGAWSAELADLPARHYHFWQVGAPAAAEAVLTALAACGPDPGLPAYLARPVAAVRVVEDVPGFAAAAGKLAADRGVDLRCYRPGGHPADPAGERDCERGAPDHDPARRELGLAAAVAARLPAGPERDLALALVAAGADPAAVLAAARTAWEAELAAPGRPRGCELRCDPPRPAAVGGADDAVRPADPAGAHGLPAGGQGVDARPGPAGVPGLAPA